MAIPALRASAATAGWPLVIDDLDSKLNQLRASRESAIGTNGISYSKGLRAD